MKTYRRRHPSPTKLTAVPAQRAKDNKHKLEGTAK